MRYRTYGHNRNYSRRIRQYVYERHRAVSNNTETGQLSAKPNNDRSLRALDDSESALAGSKNGEIRH